MHGQSLHEGQRATCNHMDPPAATAAANDIDPSRARRHVARDQAFARLLAEASMHRVDARSGYTEQTGLLSQIMP